MSEETRPLTTAELRQHRADTRAKADEIAWTLDKLKRQQYSKEEKAELRRAWGAQDDDNLRHTLAHHVQDLRNYADGLAEQHPDSFDPITGVEGVIAALEAGDVGAEALAADLRWVAAELRAQKPVTYVR